MPGMTADDLRNFALLGVGVLLVGALGAFYPGPRKLRHRVLLGIVTVAALFMAVYLLAVWRSQ
jgi:hypothetical protein